MLIFRLVVRGDPLFYLISSPKKFLWAKIFSLCSRLEDFVWTEIFLKNFIFKFFPKWCCLSEIVLNPDQAAPSERAGVCSLVREVSTFYRQCLLKISYELKLPCSSPTMACQGYLLQFLKWWKWAMNVRSYVFLKKLLFLKMLSLVLNLLTQMLIYSCVVVRRGPTAVYEEGQ